MNQFAEIRPVVILGSEKCDFQKRNACRSLIDLLQGIQNSLHRFFLIRPFSSDGERGAGAAAHAEREVAGRAAHRNREVPAVVRRAGVFHEVLDLFRAERARRLEAERRNPLRQRQVVVNRLRDMHDVDRAAHLARIIGNRRRAVRRVVAADRHEMRDAELRQRLDDRAEVGLLLRRVEAAHLQDAAARQMDAADVLRLETHVVLLAACEPREAVIDAEHVPAMARRLVRDARDDAVDARRRPATADDSNDVLDSDHGNVLLWFLVCVILFVLLSFLILVLPGFSCFLSRFFYCMKKTTATHHPDATAVSFPSENLFPPPSDARTVAEIRFIC